ncbi:uncharacterized protein [Aristolochia californica]|uniref:uncharacterized protein n=1 Tax=Aristolochia californica TaxID=171875 RepID=UPI0035DD6664
MQKGRFVFKLQIFYKVRFASSAICSCYWTVESVGKASSIRALLIVDSEFDCMDSNLKMKDPLDLVDSLSQLWCNAAVHVMKPVPHDRSLARQENFIKIVKNDTSPPLSKMDMDSGDAKPLPPWKADDLKSWIWLQQAIHPELKFERCFRKKWSLHLPRKLIPFKEISIGKWMKELKQKRKEEERLQNAEVHAAVSIASVAAALAAVAAENVKEELPNTTKESAIASAAALVAAQCAQIAEDMGANREQLSTAMRSAMMATGMSDIITVTAASATSLRGAATLKARPGRKQRGGGGGHILPFEGHKSFEMEDYHNYRTVLAKGTELKVRTMDGKLSAAFITALIHFQVPFLINLPLLLSSCDIICRTSQTIIRVGDTEQPSKGTTEMEEQEERVEVAREYQRKTDGSHQLLLVTGTVIDVDEDSISKVDGPTSIVLKTSGGMMKLEMNDYGQYKVWLVTINHMLMVSTSISGYELQFYRN